MFCSKCGNQLRDGDRFCRKCGNEILQNNAMYSSQDKKDEKLYGLYVVGITLFLVLFLFIVVLIKNEENATMDDNYHDGYMQENIEEMYEDFD